MLWSKKDIGDSFYIPQVGFNSGEVYELVGLLILYKTKNENTLIRTSLELIEMIA